MKHRRTSIVAPALVLACASAANATDAGPMPAPPIQRRPLMRAGLASPRTITRIEATEITFAEGVAAPRHRHPCPVIGQILDGTIRFQVEGSPEQILHAGDAFLEPADATILHFDNAGPGNARFLAFYLVDGTDTRGLIEVLH